MKKGERIDPDDLMNGGKPIDAAHEQMDKSGGGSNEDLVLAADCTGNQ